MRVFGKILSGLRRVAGTPVVRAGGWQSMLGGSGGAGGANLGRPYATSAWVRAAVQYVAAPIAMRPLKFTADRRGGDVAVDNPDLTRFWERPARSAAGVMSRQDFLEATVGLLKLRGQCHWIMDDTWLTRGTKSRLVLARHGSMHAVMSGNELSGWVWTDANGRRSALIPEQVVHLRFWNPYHEVLGLSEWEAAMIAAEADHAGGVFARNLALNNGDRGVYVIGKGGGQFSDEQIAQVTAQLRMKRELGRTGEFRAAFLPADVEVTEPGLAAVDTAFVAQRLENRKEVFAAFGVPVSFADPQASYSVGSASDRFRLIEDTCMPLAAKIAEGIEQVTALLLGTAETVFVEFDWDSHSTMQQVRVERFEVATKAIDRGMPWRVASDYFRLGLPRFRGDEVGRIPYSLTEVGAEMAPMDSPAATVSDTGATMEDPLEDLERLFAARNAAQVQAAGTMPAGEPAAALPCGCTGGGTETRGAGEVNPEWERVHRARRGTERAYRSRIGRLLMAARAETLRRIEAAGATRSADGVVRRMDVLELVFDLGEFLGDWTRGLSGLAADAMQRAGLELWANELERDDPLTMPARQVAAAISQRQNYIVDSGTYVHREIMRELQEGIDAGESLQKLADRTRAAFAGIDTARATMIAKTETTFAYETARAMVFKAAGVKYKKWVISGLGNERDSHLLASGQVQRMDAPFEVGGHPLMHPGEQGGPPEEVINCNCVCVATTEPKNSI